MVVVEKKQANTCDIVLVGVGAVGLGIATFLQGAGFQVAGVDRGEALEFSATVILPSLTTKKIRLLAVTARDQNEASLVLFCTKAYDLSEALATAHDTFNSQAVFVVLCNGALDGVLDHFSLRCPERLLRRGSVTMGVTRQAPARWHIVSETGLISWGHWSREIESQPSPIEQRIFEVLPARFCWTNDAMGQSHLKWLFNTTLNCFLGAKRLPRNRDALLQEQRLHDVFLEALRLGESLWGPWPQQPQALWNKLIALIHETGENENSMVADLRLKRRTEVDYLSGVALQFQGFPLLSELTKLIQAQEAES